MFNDDILPLFRSTLILGFLVALSSAAYPVSPPASPLLYADGGTSHPQEPPPNIAQSDHWEPVPITTAAQDAAGIAGGEGMQQIISLSYAPSMPDVVYMSSDTSQVWKSVDGGHHWRAKSNGFNVYGARSLFVHPKNPNVVLAAGFMGKPIEREVEGAAQGIYRSDNGGDSWKRTIHADFFKQGTTGSLFAADSRTLTSPALRVYAGTYDQGLQVSEDEGLTWDYAHFDQGHITDIDELPAAPGSLLVATDTGLFRYKDSEYRKVGKGLPLPPLSISISPANPGVVHAVVGNHNFYRSTDNGETFLLYSSVKIGTLVSDITISPIDPEILYSSTNLGKNIGPYYSHDGGKTWQKRVSISSQNLVHNRGFYMASPIAPHPKNPLEALTVSNGYAVVRRTKDGGKNWHYSGSGYSAGRVVNMAFKPNGEYVLALTDHGLWKSAYGGRYFDQIPTPEIGDKTIGDVAISGSMIVASIGAWKTQDLFISNDNGASWSKRAPVTGSIQFIRFHPQDKNIIYAGHYRSDDAGNSWKDIKYDIQEISSANGDITYSVDETQGTVLISTNRGDTWQKIAGAPTGIGINDLGLNANEDRLYVAYGSGVYIYTGSDWIKRNEQDGLLKDAHGSNNFKFIQADPKNVSIVYAAKAAPGKGISNGVFRSTDKGLNWEPYNHGLSGDINAWGMSASPLDGTIYLGTTTGLYKLR